MIKHGDNAFSDHLLEIVSINMEYKDSVLLKESVIRGHHNYIQGDMSSAGMRNHSMQYIALSCLGFAFTTTIDCPAGFWGTCSSHSLDFELLLFVFSHQCVSYLMLPYLAYALNK